MLISVIGSSTVSAAMVAAMLHVATATVETAPSRRQYEYVLGYAFERECHPMLVERRLSKIDAHRWDSAEPKESSPTADAMKSRDARHNAGSPGKMEYG